MNRKYAGLVLAALQDEAYRLNELTVKQGRMYQTRMIKSDWNEK